MLSNVGKMLRNVGQSLDQMGGSMEGILAYREHLNLSVRSTSFQGKKPLIENLQTNFIAPNAAVIGNVTIGEGSSIWYNTVLRGDINSIEIGRNTNIQDNAVVHVAKIHQDIPTKIGDSVTIGPAAIIHACTIKNQCIIGTGAQVLDGAVIEEKSIITAGSIVTKGKRVPAGQIWTGVPARYLRDLTPEEINFIQDCSAEYVELAEGHAEECNKSFEQVRKEEEIDEILETLGKDGLPQKVEDDTDKGLFFKY